MPVDSAVLGNLWLLHLHGIHNAVTITRVYNAISPAGIPCKDLAQATGMPLEEAECHLKVLMRTHKVVALNGRYIQVPQRRAEPFEGCELETERDLEAGPVMKFRDEAVNKFPVAVPDFIERKCETCKEVKHYAYYSSRKNKFAGRDWNRSCNICTSRRKMAQSPFGRWLLLQPEENWGRLRKQHKIDNHRKVDTIGWFDPYTQDISPTEEALVTGRILTVEELLALDEIDENEAKAASALLPVRANYDTGGMDAETARELNQQPTHPLEIRSIPLPGAASASIAPDPLSQDGGKLWELLDAIVDDVCKAKTQLLKLGYDPLK